MPQRKPRHTAITFRRPSVHIGTLYALSNESGGRINLYHFPIAGARPRLRVTS
jgi:hypothetical protein